MKKFTYVLLAVAAVVALASCKQKPAEAEVVETEVIEEVATPETPAEEVPAEAPVEAPAE